MYMYHSYPDSSLIIATLICISFIPHTLHVHVHVYLLIWLSTYM